MTATAKDPRAVYEKNYSSKFSALRAAKRAGLRMVGVMALEIEGGRWVLENHGDGITDAAYEPFEYHYL